ncbi:hypothetical protein MPL3356_100016 [Mesorhizobium plurifarium]|uniref:Uncharacterized protein n=1 Tax=Mesorhizobium plurifarium TaxID=69974 RepID=A0A090D9C3_MESPL|nr:hypothetical protein MPL3356_100016 [Mesorhizobium plurifarium]
MEPSTQALRSVNGKLSAQLVTLGQFLKVSGNIIPLVQTTAGHMMTIEAATVQPSYPIPTSPLAKRSAATELETGHVAKRPHYTAATPSIRPTC